MKNLLIVTMLFGSVFATNWLQIVDLTDDGSGNVTMTIGFSFDDEAKGVELDLLSAGPDGENVLTLTGGEPGAEVSEWLVNTSENGKLLAFDLSGSSVTGGGTLCTLTATYDVADKDLVIGLNATHTCDDDGTTQCDDGDTKLLLAGTQGTDLPVGFGMTSWTVGSAADLDASVAPYEFNLSKNYPNPFNPTTTIDYEIAVGSDVSIVIYDMVGREVKTLVSSFNNPGSYSAVWNAKNNQGLEVSAGMYVYKMIAGDFVKVNKMLLVK